MTQPQIIWVDGDPGCAPCFACGKTDELRMGCCFECAMDGEKRAAHRTVRQHLTKGLGKVVRCRFGFGTRMDFVWAWERLTKTGDYAPGGEFDRQYFNPEPDHGPLLGGASPESLSVSQEDQ